jgi:Transmembrane Fragile-X-F protein
MANSSNSLSLSLVIFVVFLTLKLSGVIDWSWWWVISPLWLPFALVLAVIGIISIFALIAVLINDRNVD